MKGATSNLPTISEIWDLRNAQKITDAHEEYVAFFHRMIGRQAFPTAKRYEVLVSKGVSPSDAIDYLLLEVSLLRRSHGQVRSEELLAEVLATIEAKNLEPHFQYFFQAGLNALERSESAAALDHFLGAKRYARTEKEFLSASLNAILCMENLGYDYASYVERFVIRYEPVAKEPWVSAIREQFEAFKLRNAFFLGELKAVESMARQQADGVQLNYMLSWIARLPYLDTKSIAMSGVAAERYLLDRPDGYMVPFRLRTLKCLLVAEDTREAIRLKDRIERFYLWVWLWLCHPEANLIDKIAQVQKTLLIDAKEVLSSREHLLLENACRWIGLFAGASDSRVRTSLGKLTHSQSSVPLLAYERSLLDFLYAMKDGNISVANDTYFVMTEHSLNGQKGFLLKELMRALRGEGTCPVPLRVVHASLKSLFQDRHLSVRDGLIGDLKTGSIQLIRDCTVQKEIRSVSMAQLLDATKDSSGSVSVVELVNRCFGSLRYDPMIHDPRIANLLSRANQELRPNFNWTRKGAHVFCESRPIGFMLAGTNPHSRLLWRQSQAPEFSFEGPGRKAPPAARPVSVKGRNGWLTRQDFEKMLGISRSSALRKMEEWVREDILIREGVGKASRYRMLPALEEKILQSKENMT